MEEPTPLPPALMSAIERYGQEQYSDGQWQEDSSLTREAYQLVQTEVRRTLATAHNATLGKVLSLLSEFTFNPSPEYLTKLVVKMKQSG